MWGNYGFKTESEYVKSQQTGKPSQYIGITKGVETPVRVSRAQMAEASKLKGEEQFQAFRKLGAIPFGSKFLPGPGGYRGTDWEWIHPDTIKKFKGQLLARMARASTKKPRVVLPPLEVRPTPAVREKRPVPIREKPSFAPPAFRELIEKPESVVKKLKKEPELSYIERVIEGWQDTRKQFEQGVLQVRAKATLDEITGKQQKEYYDQLGAYNSQVIEYNSQIEAMNKKAEHLEKEGAALGLGSVTKYNDEIARLNALALSLEREAAGVNLESALAVRLYNKKIDNLNKAYAALERQTGSINTTIQKANAFNVKIDRFNAELAAIKDPGEAPPEPPKTVGNVARAVYEGIKFEYKNAVREELTLKEKINNVKLLTAELVVPGVWIPSPYFGKDIKDRSAADILLNVGLDLFVVIPIARMTILGVKNTIGATAKGAVKQAVAVEAKIVKDAVKAMRKSYGRGVADSLKKVSQLQATYLRRLTKLERLKVKGKPTTRQLKATLQMENKLRVAAGNFVNEVRKAQTRLTRKGKVGAGFDSPEVARAFYSMPEELIRHTKGALQAITKPKIKKSVKQLKADVAKAEAALNAAKAKTTWDAAQWVDLVDNLMKKQAILSLKQSGGLAKIHQELIRTQQQLSRVKARMRTPGVKFTAKQRRELKIRELNLERQQLDLINKLRAGIKIMEVDWGRGGVITGRGGVATAIRPRVVPTRLTGGAAVVAPTTATMTTAQAAARAALTAAVVRVVGEPIPEVVEITKGLTDVEIIKAVEKATTRAIRAAEKLALKPSTKAELATKQKLAPAIAKVVKAALDRAVKAAPSAKIAAALQTKIAPITKAAVKVGVKVAEKVARLPVPKPKLIPRLPPRKTDKEKRKIIRKSTGAIAWRHGELHGKDVWHIGIYPYTSEEHYFTVVGRKPQNATIIKGPGSARQSIKLLYGVAPPKTVRGDVGFFDFIITPTGPKRVSIDFKPDPKMETTGDITIGRRTPPIMERPVGLGRRKSPRITPKVPALRR